MPTCLVTGTAISPDGTALANGVLRFFRTPSEVVSVDGVVVFPTPVVAVTSDTGAVSVALTPGTYRIQEDVSGVAFTATVPDDLPTVDWAYLLTAAAIVALPDVVQEVFDARDEAVAAAEAAAGAGGGGPITITGDATGTGTGTIALTLANTGVTPNSVGSATSSARITFDAKGRITGATTQTIAPAWTSVTGKPTTFAGYGLTDIPSVRDYGIVADGTTDNTAAINAAWTSLAAAGRIPLLSVPPGTGKILVTGALNPPAGAGLVGLFGRPTILMSGTTPTVVSQPDFRLVGLTLEGTHATQNYKIQITSTGALIADCTFTNWNSGLDITGNRNTVQNVQFVNVRGGGIRLRGSKYNSVVGVDGVNVTLFLVYLQDGAACNSVHRPMKRVDFATLTAWQLTNRAAEIADGQFGIECVGVTQDCYRNDVVDYYAEFTSDAGMSCSGYENTITGGRVIGCAGNALTFIGSRNTATGIVSIGNKRGVACIPTAGGLAKDNVATGCVSIGDWFAGFTNEASQLRLWQSGVTLTPASSFIRYGLNNYQSTGGATGTYGTIPPTHTSGTASDGVNTWEWISSDPDTLDADRNMFVGCIARGSGTGTPGGGVTVPGGTGTGEQYYIEAGTGANVKVVAASDTSAETGGGSSAWGGITGTLSDQTDLQTALNLKASVTDVTAGLALKADVTALAAKADVTALNLKANVTDVLSGLALKADTADLATVATSGDFGDLTGKPTTLAGFGITDAVEPFRVQPVSGEFTPNYAAGSNASMSANELSMGMWVVPFDMVITDVGLSVTTAGGAGTLVKVAIYDTHTSKKPRNLLAESPTMDAASIGMKSATLGAPLTLTKGQVLWLGVRASGAVTITRGLYTEILSGMGTIGTWVRNSVSRSITFGTGAPSSWTWTNVEFATPFAPLVLMKVQ